MPELKQHYWVAEGTGELSSRWVNPVCDRTVRRHIDDFVDHGDDPNSGKCVGCLAVVAALKVRAGR